MKSIGNSNVNIGLNILNSKNIFNRETSKKYKGDPLDTTFQKFS